MVWMIYIIGPIYIRLQTKKWVKNRKKSILVKLYFETVDENYNKMHEKQTSRRIFRSFKTSSKSNLNSVNKEMIN